MYLVYYPVFTFICVFILPADIHNTHNIKSVDCDRAQELQLEIHKKRPM